MIIYLPKKALIALLNIEQVFKSISAKNWNLINISLKELAIELSEYLDIKKYIIDFKNNKQLLYRLIYSLELIELKTIKTYIKTNLVNSLI